MGFLLRKKSPAPQAPYQGFVRGPLWVLSSPRPLCVVQKVLILNCGAYSTGNSTWRTSPSIYTMIVVRDLLALLMCLCGTGLAENVKSKIRVFIYVLCEIMALAYM